MHSQTWALNLSLIRFCSRGTWQYLPFMIAHVYSMPSPASSTWNFRVQSTSILHSLSNACKAFSSFRKSEYPEMRCSKRRQVASTSQSLLAFPAVLFDAVDVNETSFQQDLIHCISWISSWLCWILQHSLLEYGAHNQAYLMPWPGRPSYQVVSKSRNHPLLISFFPFKGVGNDRNSCHSAGSPSSLNQICAR